MRNKNGQSLVEMAVVLPVLILIIMGVIEFGRIFNAQLILQNLSREGARYAATGKSDSEIVSLLTQDTYLLGNHATISINITPSPANRVRGEKVSVRVDYAIPLIAPLAGVIMTNPYPLSAQTFMRVE